MQDVHGTGLLPPDYANRDEPSWCEAARWLARQAALFNKGKLNPLRAVIIRETLGASLLACREHHACSVLLQLAVFAVVRQVFSLNAACRHQVHQRTAVGVQAATLGRQAKSPQLRLGQSLAARGQQEHCACGLQGFRNKWHSLLLC